MTYTDRGWRRLRRDIKRSAAAGRVIRRSAPRNMMSDSSCTHSHSLAPYVDKSASRNRICITQRSSSSSLDGHYISRVINCGGGSTENGGPRSRSRSVFVADRVCFIYHALEIHIARGAPPKEKSKGATCSPALSRR